MNPASAFINSVIYITEVVLDLYVWMLIIGAILSWLIVFGVVNRNNSFVLGILDFVRRLSDPLLNPIRRKVKPINGIDLSPLILILIIMFIQHFLRYLVI